MNFHPRHAAKVLAREKTQTRRPVKDGDETVVRGAGDIVAVLNDGRPRYRVAHTYALQVMQTRIEPYTQERTRALQTIGAIKITGIRRELLDAITDKDLKAEGWEKRDDLFNYWHDVYGGGPATVGVATGDPDVDDPEAVEVWVLDFELDVRPNFLHKDSTRAYTASEHDALELVESPSPRELDQLAEANSDNFADVRARDLKRRAKLSRLERLTLIERALNDPSHAGSPAHVRDHLKLIDAQLGLIERYLRDRGRMTKAA